MFYLVVTDDVGYGDRWFLEGPDAEGKYTVRYQPTADQVNRGGRTVAELHLMDVSGSTIIGRQEFDTP